MKYVSYSFPNQKFILFGALCGLLLSQGIIPEITFASLPWDSKFEAVYESITGPVASAITGIVICVTGFMIGASEGGGAARRGIQFILGLSLALGVVQFMEFFRS